MGFNERLQELRKQKGLTQEELAGHLFVSRTAVSKWESGRGYPNIDSLKAIAAYFSVTIDELLSGGEAPVPAEEDNKQKAAHFQNWIFALLDCSAAALMLLPVFGQRTDGIVSGVSLLSLSGTEAYLQIIYFAVVIGMTIWGIVSLALRNCCRRLWEQTRRSVSLMLNGIGALIFIISLQPYAATILFVYLAVKALMLIRRR